MALVAWGGRLLAPQDWPTSSVRDHVAVPSTSCKTLSGVLHTGFQNEHGPGNISGGRMVWGPRTPPISFLMSPEVRRDSVLTGTLPDVSVQQKGERLPQGFGWP